jgi:biopolymer transport protein TolR
MRTRKKRKLKAEINVVPYIDVMLVLLIIFMVTAPLLNLGVDIKLPQSTAKAVQVDKEPILIGVDKDGKFYLTVGSGEREMLEPDALVKKVAAFVRQDPQVPVLLGADERTMYGKVYQILPGLKDSGVSKISLISTPLAADPRK